MTPTGYLYAPGVVPGTLCLVRVLREGDVLTSADRAEVGAGRFVFRAASQDAQLASKNANRRDPLSTERRS